MLNKFLRIMMSKKTNTTFTVPTSFSLKEGSGFEQSVDGFVESHQNLDLQDLVRIDAGNIEGDLLCVSENISTVSILLANAENKLLHLKQKVSDCYAELYKNYKENYGIEGKKLTIEDLKNLVLTDKSYQSFLGEQNKCILLVDIIKGVKTAIETKGRILRDIYSGDKAKELLTN